LVLFVSLQTLHRVFNDNRAATTSEICVIATYKINKQHNDRKSNSGMPPLSGVEMGLPFRPDHTCPWMGLGLGLAQEREHCTWEVVFHLLTTVSLSHLADCTPLSCSINVCHYQLSRGRHWRPSSAKLLQSYLPAVSLQFYSTSSFRLLLGRASARFFLSLPSNMSTHLSRFL
jgi:hypothetical protein